MIPLIRYKPGTTMGNYNLLEVVSTGRLWKHTVYKVLCTSCQRESERTAEQLFHAERKAQKYCKQCASGNTEVKRRVPRENDRTSLPQPLVGGGVGLAFINGRLG